MAMTVVNREGQREDVRFDRILERIQGLAFGLAKQVEPVLVAQRTIEGLYDGITTRQLDELAAETAAGFTAKHPDYGKLAARIAVSNLHKETSASFSETIDALHHYVDPRTGLPAPLISDEVHAAVIANKDRLDTAIRHERDLEYDYFGYKTLERSYLLRLDGQVAERPQYMLMRVAVGIHLRDMEAVLETYDLLSRGLYTHATPTLFNAGTLQPQMSSCFLLAIKDDSLSGIYGTLNDCAQISKSAGGLGLSVHQIRSKGTYIRGTNGSSNGLIPMLRVFNATARYVDQGGGKRKGALAVYLEPWHPDVFEFLDLRKNTGAEEMRCRDLFTAMWVPDLFMKRVQDDGMWSLLDPHECPGLHTSHGAAFEELYLRYEAQGKARKTIRAQELWAAIVQSQIETGTPYMLYKDHANNKSNQKNLGTIRSSNLCTEIMEYTDENEIAVCNLASIALPRYVNDGKYDYDALWHVTYRATRNLNKVIDRNYYPVPEARNSNLKHRPVGLGVQGLADTFAMLRLPFESDAAKQVNRNIFETIYHAAVTASCDLAQEEGPYESYEGSPASQGLLQYDLWNEKPSFGKWDWTQLKAKIARFGLRNSLLVAPMPTASTSQILGNNECFEPFTSNIYARRTLSGEFMVVNQHLVRDLIRLGLWDDAMKDEIIRGKGSIQHIEAIPADVRELYKTVWEIKQKTIVDMAADRGAFIDQSQSMNIHMVDANYAKVTSLHFHAWKRGLKTGMYYLRTKAAVDAIQFTLDPAKKPVAADKPVVIPIDVAPSKTKEEVRAEIACSLDNPESCVSCGS